MTAREWWQDVNSDVLTLERRRVNGWSGRVVEIFENDRVGVLLDSHNTTIHIIHPSKLLIRVAVSMLETREIVCHMWMHVTRMSHVPRTKIPKPPIHFSGATNFFGPKNEFTSHQFETSVLEPPMSFSPLSNHQTVVKPRASRLNFYEGPIPVSEFVNCAERGRLGVESSQSRVSAGSTCLSVAKVPPDYAAYIPPILGGHPVTASVAKPFFPERKDVGATSGETENSLSVFSRLCSFDMHCTVNRHLTGAAPHSASYVETFVSVWSSRGECPISLSRSLAFLSGKKGFAAEAVTG
jgi:hypothetical protein